MSELSEKLVSASRGLLVKLKEESNHRFSDLVSAGETESETPVLSQLKADLQASLEDRAHTAEQLKKASVGLVIKLKNTGTDYFEELVKLGSKSPA